jgi:hypothetical protein
MVSKSCKINLEMGVIFNRVSGVFVDNSMLIDTGIECDIRQGKWMPHL